MLSPLASILIAQLFVISVPIGSASRYRNHGHTDPFFELKKKFQKAEISNGYTIIPGVGAYKVHTLAAAWSIAERICETEEAYLAVINSEEEAEAIRLVISAAGRYKVTLDDKYTLVGFRYHDTKKDFLTIFGTSLRDAGFCTWSTGQPDNYNNWEYCGSVRNADGYLSDVNCNLPYGYICEKSISYLD